MMTRRVATRRRGAATGAAMAVGMLLVLTACGSGTSDSANSAGSGSGGTAAKEVTVRQTSLGNLLVDDRGMTMYAFAADSKGHSVCEGSCLTYWPPVAGSEKAHVAKQVKASVGTTTRKDGSTQLTVAGYPMYTYVGDAAAGQANGQGKNLSGGLWWVVAPNGSWIKTSGGSGASPASGGN